MRLDKKFFMEPQGRFIRDDSRIIVVEKARQTGFSFATAYKITRATAGVGNPYDAWVSSRDDMQAQLFGEDCVRWARMLDLAAGDLAVKVIDQAEKVTAHVLPFANGRSINSMSSNPNAQAGKRGTRVLDEFALHPDPRKLYSIAYPGITWGGQMILISTHRGTANFFNELVLEVKHKGNPKGISLHTVTIVDAIRAGLLDKLKAKWSKEDPRQAWGEDEYLQDVRSKCADEESWQQEYMCQPADDSTAFLSYDLIAGCRYQPTEAWETDILDAKGKIYIGVDVGRVNDLTVIWVIERLGDVFYTRRVITMKNETFAAQEFRLYSLLQMPQVQRCCIDQTGIGRQFAERAQERFGRYKVEGVTFTAGVKEEIAYPVRSAFEDRTIRIPDDKLITSDLRAIKKTQTAGDNVRFEADRSANGHADRFWALSLALLAGKQVREVGAMVG